MIFRQNKLNYRAIIWWILGIALFLRVIWALAIPVIPVSDSAAYDTFAWNMVNSGTYGWTADQPSSFWPVGTSAIYAFFYYIFGHVYWPIVVFNIAVGVATTAAAMALSRKLFGIPTSFITGILVAAWPSQIMYVTVLASELPFTLVTLLALLFWLRGGERKLTNAIIAGALLAAASYIRPLALLLPFIFVAVEVVRHKQWQIQIKMFAVAFIVMATLIAPWSIRNSNLWNEFVLISTNGPIVLWMGNNPDTNGVYTKLPEWSNSLSEYEKAQELGKLSREYIISEPISFIVRSFEKTVKVHASETIAVHWNKKGINQTFGESSIFPMKVITQAYWIFIILSALWGIFILYREAGFVRWFFHPALVVWCYYASVHGIILAQDRYHFPSVPYIAALSAYAIYDYFKKRKGNESG